MSEREAGEYERERKQLGATLVDQFRTSAMFPHSIQPRLSGTPLPLSLPQEQFWFHEQLQPGTAANNVSFCAWVNGPLDRSALERAVAVLVRRHETLRTSVRLDNGVPGQCVHPSGAVQPEFVDLYDLPEAAREEAALEKASTSVRTAFDLTTGPLVRVQLVRVAPERHLLILVAHHIVCDGWSLGIALRELMTLYEADLAGRSAALADLPIQYGDFSLWQRAWFAGGEPLKQLDYWRRQLAGVPVLQLPSDRPRPPVQSIRGAWAEFTLPAALSSGLRSLSRQAGVTLFMTLLAGWQAVLQRWSGQDDIAVGSPIANRRPPETRTLIGPFVNTLVLRTDLSGAPSFRQLLARVRDVCLAAYTHQDLPFETLVKELRPERELSHTPLFQVLFALQSAPLPVLQLAGAALEPVELGTGTSRFDLELYIRDSARELKGRLDYSADLFDEATAVRLLNHFRRLLEAAVADPDRPLPALALLTEQERRQLGMFSRGPAVPVPTCCLHQLVEAQAGRTPERTAVVWGTERCSYRELNERANQLAHHLKALGVGPDRLVGVCLERSTDLLVALLAVLKAGGAYVPVDPSYPEERIRLTLEDARIMALVTTEVLVKRLPAIPAPAICLDRDLSVIASRSSGNLARETNPSHLAYVLYTSGSTGRPKGVAIGHASVVNFITWAQHVFTAEELAGVLAATSVCFDLSVFELYVPLSTGGTVILAENVLQVASLPAAGEVTLINTVPSAIVELLRMNAIPRSVLTVNLAGEALPNSVVRQLYGQEHIRQVYNLYGPTETTTYSTFTPVEKGGDQTPAIGRPIANTRVYVLDGHMQPVPIGVPGEVYIGGMGLALGYLGRPDLTAERFAVADSPEPGARLYRTGDLARWRSDGNLEYLGRIDHQVKLRGFRIELGEIEAVLAQHPHVQQAVVALQAMQPGHRRLVAYLLPVPGETLSPGALRDFLRTRLPDFMVPAAFVTVSALPLTPSGKIDRNALPQPEADPTSDDGDVYVPPRTPAEALVAATWAEVLGLPRVGVFENFFDLGGHSLLATRVAVRLREALGVAVPLRLLFEHPTVAELAGHLPSSAAVGTVSPVIPQVQRSRVAADGRWLMPSSFGQQRLWFLCHLDPASSAAYNLSGAVSIAGPLRTEALRQAINAVVNRHEVLRTGFVVIDGEVCQAISPSLQVDVPTIDISQLAGDEREAEVYRLADAEAQSPFDLSRGPLLRAVLIRQADEQHVLLITLHHTVSDGWSIELLVREVGAYYGRGAACTLPDLPVQYADFAAWQRDLAAGAGFREQMAYWHAQLADLPALDVPLDRPRPPTQTYSGATCTKDLPAALVATARQVSGSEGATLFMTLLAAFQALLARYTGQDDVAVGTPVANRDHPELQGLIGFLVNTLVLRTDLSDGPDFRTLLHRVRETCLQAYTHQDAPFEQVVNEVRSEHDRSRPSLFQVMFALQNAPLPLPDMGGLELTLLEADHRTAKFDLTLTATEMGQGLRLALEYNTDLFEELTARRLLDHFERLLEGALADPGCSVTHLPLLTTAEQSWLAELNQTAADYPSDRCVHQLFEEQAGRTPGAVAVACAGERLTYGELNRRANQLAHRLRALGVGPGVPVGICLERSVEMTVGLLGIMKAGGAYMPLDPGYPHERLLYMLEEAGVSVLLCQARLAGLFPGFHGRVLRMDADWDSCAALPAENPAGGATPDDLICLIYTSGSTGRPKAAGVYHRGYVNLLHWFVTDTGISADDRFLMCTSLSFDLTQKTIYACLVRGGQLHLLPASRYDPGLIAQIIGDDRITLINCAPSAFYPLVENAAYRKQLGSLRYVFLGGEPISMGRLEPWLIGGEGTRTVLVNHYGPTECSDVVAFHRVEDPARYLHEVVPLGRPVPNTQLWVLDRFLQPVPVGVAGELCITGDCVGAGYLTDPRRTAERFVPNPFGPGRLYRTGDLVRRRPDGLLEYLGRMDYQVKVRGVRVELGEIEAVLGEHPAIRQAIVVAREVAPRDSRLIAYVVASPNATTTDHELLSYLRTKLPEAMLPAAIVFLDAFPTTPSGKVDRKALPAPDATVSQPGAVAPRSPMEEAVAAIWCEVLRVPEVGVYDNFFDLGGNSLLAVQLQARLQARFQVELPLSTLFEAPTVAELTTSIVQRQAAASDEAELSRLLEELEREDRCLTPESTEGK